MLNFAVNHVTATVLLLFAIIVAVVAQIRVSMAFNRYSQVRARRGRTGAEVAEEILRDAGITNVAVVAGESFLGDHYDPMRKELCLSPGVYDSDSVAALGIAAHECGHAIQHKESYAPLQIRMAVVPFTMVANQMLPFIMIGGFFFGLFRAIPWLLDLGIAAYAMITVFQLITLPVEFDASRRAKSILTSSGAVAMDEIVGVNKVLNAAALTYVAALLTAFAHLLQLLAIRNDRD